MISGRINSEESMATAARVIRAAGASWQAVEDAATRDEEGVYVVRRSDLQRLSRERITGPR